MRKLLLLFLCGLFAVVEPEMLMAASPAASAEMPIEAAEAVGAPRVPSPSYKRYRGNSRRKRGPIAALKRWHARRRTRRALKSVHRTKPRQGKVTVDKPIRNK